MSGRRDRCSLCRRPSTFLLPGIDFGQTPLANAYAKTAEEARGQQTYPLDVVVCEGCGHSQVGFLVDSPLLFSDYAYATGTSKVTLDHLMGEALYVSDWYKKHVGLALDSKSFVLEVGCNDGSMLKIWKSWGVGRVLGIDPAASKLKAHDVDTMDAFFCNSLGHEVKKSHGEADIVIANNVFAHVPDVMDVAEGVRAVLAEGGIFVFEVSYLYDMVEAPLFDTIYHEHMSYHAVRPLAQMLDILGMPIVDAVRLKSQRGRGSLRIIARKGSGKSLGCDKARDLMVEEAAAGLWGQAFWVKLHGEVFEAGNAVRSWVEALRDMGERVVGYGAAAKLTTLMYALKLGPGHIDYVVDDSKWKQGLYTPGSGIEIVAPSRMAEEQPGACVVFAWNFAESIITKSHWYTGRWVLPLPELQEISK